MATLAIGMVGGIGLDVLLRTMDTIPLKGANLVLTFCGLAGSPSGNSRQCFGTVSGPGTAFARFHRNLRGWNCLSPHFRLYVFLEG